VTPSASPYGRAAHQATQADHSGGCPGVVAGAVLRSARLSAGISIATLAAASGVGEETIEAWEEGSSPLASVPLPQVEEMETSLRNAGANPHLVADFAAAAWCDLVIVAIADHKDTTCLMADRVANEIAFGELLAWSLTGNLPARYQPYADPVPLLTNSTLIEQVIQTLDVPLRPPSS